MMDHFSSHSGSSSEQDSRADHESANAIAEDPESDAKRAQRLVDQAFAVEVVRWLRGGRPTPPAQHVRTHARIVARIEQLRRTLAETAGSGMREVLLQDLAHELIAIRSLRQLIPYLSSDDPATRPLIEEILESEAEHADALSLVIDHMHAFQRVPRNRPLP